MTILNSRKDKRRKFLFEKGSSKNLQRNFKSYYRHTGDTVQNFV